MEYESPSRDQQTELLERYRLSVESAPIGQALVGSDGTWLYANPALCKLLRASPGDLVGRRFHDVTHPDDLDRNIEALNDLVKGRSPSLLSFEKRYVALDGTVVPAKVHVSQVKDERGNYRYHIVQIEDLTEYKRNEQAVINAHGRLAALVENSSDVLAIYDNDGIFQFISPACFEAYGRRPEELIGTHVVDLIHPDDKRNLAELAAKIRGGDRGARFTYRVQHPERGWRHFEVTLTNHVDNPAVRGFVANARDVTDRIKVAAQLAHQATHDPLTGLPNRVLFMERLTRAVSERDDRLGVLFIDLDWFKGINDTLGHSIGDQILIVVAQRMQRAQRPGDCVGRLGGDEFVVLMNDVVDPAQAIAVAEQLQDVITAPIEIAGQVVALGCSVGIAFPAPTRNPEMVMQEADLAMYQAKELGRNRIEVYDEPLRAKARGHLGALQALRRALDNDDVVVLYQPLVALQTRSVVACESLTRLRLPDGELLGADQFIPVAEDSGLIIPLGEVVLRQACQQMSSWRAAGAPIRRIGVNVSARQLESPNFAGICAAVMAQYGLGPGELDLEITESTLIRGSATTRHNIYALKEAGAQLKLDDFGTGWASLSHLRKFPFDGLKIDRSFIAGLGTNRDDTVVVQAIVGLGRSLGLTVAAEGVETQSQEDLLRSFGCDLAQGYLYDQPLPADELGKRFLGL